jgi:hypothetical protein
VKLLRIKITDPQGFRSLQAGFEHHLRTQWELQEEQGFAPNRLSYPGRPETRLAYLDSGFGHAIPLCNHAVSCRSLSHTNMSPPDGEDAGVHRLHLLSSAVQGTRQWRWKFGDHWENAVNCTCAQKLDP